MMRIFQAIGILSVAYLAIGAMLATAAACVTPNFDVFAFAFITLLWPFLLFAWFMYAITLG